MNPALYGIAAALAAFVAPAAGAAEIKVIASNAVREPYHELVPAFEKATGHKVTIDWGGTVDIVKKVGGSEVAANGHWQPTEVQSLRAVRGVCEIHVPAASAAMLTNEPRRRD